MPTLFYDGTPIGNIRVARYYPRKLFGQFLPAITFEEYRTAFEDALRWSRQFAERPSNQSADYLAWDNWSEAIQRITNHISLPEISVEVEEFAIEHNFEVEITFKEPLPNISFNPDALKRAG